MWWSPGAARQPHSASSAATAAAAATTNAAPAGAPEARPAALRTPRVLLAIVAPPPSAVGDCVSRISDPAALSTTPSAAQPTLAAAPPAQLGAPLGLSTGAASSSGRTVGRRGLAARGVPAASLEHFDVASAHAQSSA